MWNIWKNVQKKYRKSHEKLSPVFYTMAKTCNQSDFDRLMKIVERVDILVKKYFKLAGYDKWSRMHAPVHHCSSITSNIAESINATLVPSRELSIYDFLEEVRVMIDRWNYDNKNEASLTFIPLIEKFQETLKINEAMSTQMMG